jgi:hypothetical protein
MVLPVCQDKSTLGANDEPNWDSMMEPMANSAMLLTYKAATKRFFKAAALEGTAEFKMHKVAEADVPRPRRKRTATRVFGEQNTRRVCSAKRSKRVEAVKMDKKSFDEPFIDQVLNPRIRLTTSRRSNRKWRRSTEKASATDYKNISASGMKRQRGEEISTRRRLVTQNLKVSFR